MGAVRTPAQGVLEHALLRIPVSCDAMVGGRRNQHDHRNSHDGYARYVHVTRCFGQVAELLRDHRGDLEAEHGLSAGQFTSLAFGKRCKEAGVRPSIGSVSDAYDNAMCESFFATLECELLERRRFASQAEARMACFGFIESWYNPARLHSGLGYRSPIAYETAVEVTTAEA